MAVTSPTLPSRYETAEAINNTLPGSLTPGPLAVIFAEDSVEVESTLRHHIKLGFGTVVLFADADLDLDPELVVEVIWVVYKPVDAGRFQSFLNPIIAKCPGTWIYYCVNADYLFFPLCETRR